jgi:hypothetical protein
MVHDEYRNDRRNSEENLDLLWLKFHQTRNRNVREHLDPDFESESQRERTFRSRF